jgi:hypothetical protein
MADDIAEVKSDDIPEVRTGEETEKENVSEAPDDAPGGDEKWQAPSSPDDGKMRGRFSNSEM